MKNNNQNDIKTARQNHLHKTTANTDILVVPDVVEDNMQRLAQRPRPKRRRNYIKKIMNDSFIMNA